MNEAKSKTEYDFEKQVKVPGFRYARSQKIDKKTQRIFYMSYVSEASDLNDSTWSKLQKHKAMLDLAISMVEKQYKEGMRSPAIIYPQGLNKNYQFHVYKHVKSKIEQKNQTKEKKENCSQPYWVYADKIRTYEFRNKDRSSKFQAFIEFESSYSDSETIKVNLRLSKKGYENRHTFYKDGFDIVYNGPAVRIRHVSELIVNLKADNKIEKHIMIDAWANIHTILVDKNDTNVDDRDRPRFNEDRKLVCGLQEKFGNTTNMKRIIANIKSFKNPELYKKRLDALQNCVRAKLRTIIGKDDESKVIILEPTCLDSKLYKELVDTVKDEVSKICQKSGIKCIKASASASDLKSLIVQHKKKSNDWAEKHNYGRKFNLDEHIKWHEFMIASLLLMYPDFYPILKRGGKFSTSTHENTDKNDCQVLDKPKYPSFEDFKKQWLTLSEQFPYEYATDEVSIRKGFVLNAKTIAQEWHIEQQKAQGIYEDCSDDGFI